MPVQPVDATPYNQLIREYFPSRINLYASTPLEPKQGFVLFEFEARERNHPHRLVEEAFQQVLHRPVEPGPFFRHWRGALETE
jgi:hypothetical protein